MLEEAYEKAAELAYKFVPEKAAEVVSTVCQRLVQVNRHSVAADLYLGVDMITEAVQVRRGIATLFPSVMCTFLLYTTRM
jgi:intraflagellar transport protein 172